MSAEVDTFYKVLTQEVTADPTSCLRPVHSFKYQQHHRSQERKAGQHEALNCMGNHGPETQEHSGIQPVLQKFT